MSAEIIHSLGMTLAVALAGAAMASAAQRPARWYGARGRRAGQRRWRPGGARVGRSAPLGAGLWTRMRTWGPPAAVGLGVLAVLGGALGALAGIGAALGAFRWLSGRQRAGGGSRTNGASDGPAPDSGRLPLCADLMAACLAAGAGPAEAAGAVGRCLGGALGEALIRVRAELRLGADPAECWDRFAKLPGAREMGRCLARSSTRGTAPVAEMVRLAADHRAAQSRAALARARRAAVLATAPLGVCFLPAFLLVGVAPVVIGLAGALLGTPTR
jgi:hypothetical protein